MVTIFSNRYAFAALKSDGSVKAWGYSDWGGTDPGITSGVVNIFSSQKLFIAVGGTYLAYGPEVSGTGASSFNEFNIIQAWGESSNGGADPGLNGYYLKIVSTKKAFAVLKNDGSVTAWGQEDEGGCVNGNGESNTNCMPYGLSDVVDIFSDENPSQKWVGSEVFAALKSDGSVIVWGGDDEPHPTISGNSGLIKIISTSRFNKEAFAVLKRDGSVQVWGNADNGGTDPGLTSGVIDIFCNKYAFAAVKSDGSVKAWGIAGVGGTDPGITSGVIEIISTDSAFAALKSDGSVQVWGDAKTGGCNSGVMGSSGSNYYHCIPSNLANVVKIFANKKAFVALTSDGGIQTWGDWTYGGKNDLYAITSGVVDIYFTMYEFVALMDDGSVTRIGSACGTTNGCAPPSGLDADDDVTIVANVGAFAFLLADGTIYGSGSSNYGGTDAPDDANYIKIIPGGAAFAGIKQDGSVTVWGSENWGGTDPGTCSDGVSTDKDTCEEDNNTWNPHRTPVCSDWQGNDEQACLADNKIWTLTLTSGSGVENIISNYYAFVALGGSTRMEYGPEMSGTGASSFKKTLTDGSGTEITSDADSYTCDNKKYYIN